MSSEHLVSNELLYRDSYTVTVTTKMCWGNLSSYKQDSIWSWFICFFTAICMILSVGFSFALGVLFPVFMNYFDENREKTGEFVIIYCTSHEFYNPTGIVSAGNFDVPQDIQVYTFCYDYYLSR